MGVKTPLTLDEAKALFSEFSFINIQATDSGIIDTTYIVTTNNRSYILKKYERDIEEKIKKDAQLLYALKSQGLNVPTLIRSNNTWFLYEKLLGEVPKHMTLRHIQALAQFISKMHMFTSKLNFDNNFVEPAEVEKSLQNIKYKFYFYYKKLQFLQNYKAKKDGLIHGDIFKDNTVFDGFKIGVFDFIDAGCGEFVFDIAVALVSFNAKKHPIFIELFLNTYNQRTLKKIKKKELLKYMEIASGYYALLRIETYKHTKQAKELL